eukprot:6259241-Karenia_brevis.AAC.1
MLRDDQYCQFGDQSVFEKFQRHRVFSWSMQPQAKFWDSQINIGIACALAMRASCHCWHCSEYAQYSQYGHQALF